MTSMGTQSAKIPDPLEEAETIGLEETMVPVVTASILGTMVGWYDVYLSNFFSLTVFPVVFFPKLDPVAGVVASLSANFVGFAARPLGGVLFGWFGDRVGRRSTLVATLLLMGTVTVLMGVLPGYGTLGIAAPLLLGVLRFLQGVGVGGEWGGAVLLTLEYGDARRRGFWASWPQTGVPIALALAALVVLLFEYLYPGDAFLSIGWRMPFIFGAMLVVIGLYIRLRITETPAFVRIKAENEESRSPLLDAFRYGWREILFSTLIRSGEQAPFYLFTTFVLSYGTMSLHIDATWLYASLTLAAGISFFTMPTFSAISDRVGRKRWYQLGCVAMGICIFPYFFMLNTGIPILIVLSIVLSLCICHAWLYVLQGAFISEQFPIRFRYTGASFGYQLASVTAGGPAPIVATYLLKNHSGLTPGVPAYVPVALYIVGMCVISFVAVFPLKEYAGKPAAGDTEMV